MQEIWGAIKELKEAAHVLRGIATQALLQAEFIEAKIKLMTSAPVEITTQGETDG